jgi:hypothetical protein
LFSNNSVNNDPDNTDEDEEEDEDDSCKGEDDLDEGKSIGSFNWDSPENNENVPHVHVVMNHNPQKDSMAINFTGLLSHLALFIALPWVLSVSLLISFVQFNSYNVNLYIIFHFIFCHMCYD